MFDATFSSRTTRDWLRDQAKAAVRLQVVELEADHNRMAKRLKTRDQSEAELSDARLEDLEKLSAAYEPPKRVTNFDQSVQQ